MAALSIVDFVKQSLEKGSANTESQGSDNPEIMSLVKRALGSAVMQGSLSPSNEVLYVTYASKVLPALQGNDTGGLTARQLFDQAEIDNFPAFQLALAEMVRRNLVRVSGRDPRYGDEVYSLSSSPAA
jgi:hypothetical protein